jgi:O-antigen/teichoic acid export membrane protein
VRYLIAKSDLDGILIPLLFLTKNNIVIAVLSYALTISLANSLGPSQFGIYSEALLIASVLSIVINFGSDQTAVVSYSNSRSKREVFSSIFTTRVIMAVTCLLLLALSAKIDFSVFYFVACLSLSCFNLAFLYEIRRKNEKYSYIFLVERTIYIGSAFFTIYTSRLELHYLFSTYAVATIASILYQHIDSRRHIYIGSNQILKTFRRTFLENIPLVVVALSTFVYGGFSRLILADKLGTERLGVYSAGWQLITIGTMYQAQVSRIWRIGITEAIYSQNTSDLKRQVATYLIFGTLPMAVLCSLFILGSRQIVELLFSSAYTGLISVLPLFGLYLVVISLAGLVDILWIALRNNRVYMFINLSSGFSLLVFLMGFSDGIGMVGFAAISVLFHFLTTVALAALWLLYYKLKRTRP